jgi:hypothetical protein
VFLGVEDIAVREQIGLKLLVEIGAVPAHPFKDHGGVFNFLAHVVQEDFLERRIVAVVGPLAIPVGGFDLFYERYGGLMHREGGLAQALAGRVKVVARHGVGLLLGCGNLAGAARPVDRP